MWISMNRSTSDYIRTRRQLHRHAYFSYFSLVWCRDESVEGWCCCRHLQPPEYRWWSILLSSCSPQIKYAKWMSGFCRGQIWVDVCELLSVRRMPAVQVPASHCLRFNWKHDTSEVDSAKSLCEKHVTEDYVKHRANPEFCNKVSTLIECLLGIWGPSFTSIANLDVVRVQPWVSFDWADERIAESWANYWKETNAGLKKSTFKEEYLSPRALIEIDTKMIWNLLAYLSYVN